MMTLEYLSRYEIFIFSTNCNSSQLRDVEASNLSDRSKQRQKEKNDIFVRNN